MKKVISSIFVFLLAVALLTGVAASSASAATGQSGYTTKPWYAGIDESGQFSNQLTDLFQNSAQYVIYNPGFSPMYIIAAHPNYEPSGDNQYSAKTATFVTKIAVYNAQDVPVDCTVGGTFQALNTYVKTTSAGIPYLKFSIAFTKYDSASGNEIGSYSTDPAFFSLDSITPPPLPTYEFK
jgi:hypothetical protein